VARVRRLRSSTSAASFDREVPKETDNYSIETWEEIAMRLADRAGIATPEHELVQVAGKRCSSRAGLTAPMELAFLSCRRWR
jgi:hypothetical protein